MEIEREYNDFGPHIKNRRETLGLSQQDLASLVGLSRVSMANIEAGRQRVLLHQAIHIAKALGFSLGDFQCETVKRSLDASILHRTDLGETKLSNALRELRGSPQ